ncbi:MAG: sugar-binding domain-containing protein [Chloroflexota bacterium]|jgi:DNA-binding transcriptional regulator LsrR (DeoR family)
MSKYRRGDERDQLLADVAEMYYVQDLTQAEISRQIDMTRSAVSRMLTEARDKGIVEINVRRPLRFDDDLEAALKERFGLQAAHVLVGQRGVGYDKLRCQLGLAAAAVLKTLLQPGISCGVAWGTTVSATIEALDAPHPLPVQVVQLVGVLRSNSHAFNAQALVDILAGKVGGEGVYLYSPFIVENAATARSIRNIPDVRESLEAGKGCDIVLMGIGTVLDPAYSSLYQGGHISLETLERLRRDGAVGDVGGVHIDIDGHPAGGDFNERMVGIAGPDLLAIPTRLAVAGGVAKAEAILGALRGGYTNLLVTDSQTAQAVLERDGGKS